MTTLTDDQLQFLDRCGVDLSQVFDATGLSRPDYQEIMRDHDLLVAYGVSRCKNGHTLRTRSGHCLMCKPDRISYLRRHDKPATVYVARSPSSGLVKVGSAGCARQRVQQLSQEVYGGAADWVLEVEVDCSRSGRAEVEAHRYLWAFQASGGYVKDSEYHDCRELFACDVDIAIGMVRHAVEEVGEM